MKYKVFILSLILLFLGACSSEYSSKDLKEGRNFTTPDLLYFNNIRSSAYLQTDRGGNILSYELKQLKGKPLTVEILMNKLRDKAEIKIRLDEKYALWESNTDIDSKLIQIDQLNMDQQTDLLRRISGSNEFNYALQFLEPNTNGSIETISNSAYKRNLATCLRDFDLLTKSAKD